MVIYVDDCLIFAPTEEDLKKAYNDINDKFEIRDDTSEHGTIDSYLGIKVDHYSDGSFRMSQPFLI